MNWYVCAKEFKDGPPSISPMTLIEISYCFYEFPINSKVYKQKP